MSKIVKEKMYCPKCKKEYLVDVVLSTNSYMISRDPLLMRKAQAGELFINRCPKCGKELKEKEDE